MRFTRRNKYGLAVERKADDGWDTVFEDRLDRAPKNLPALAAFAFVCWVAEAWAHGGHGKKPHRLVLYRYKRNGVRKMMQVEPIPPDGWGVEDYGHPQWPA